MEHIVCKYFLPFCMFPFLSVDCFLFFVFAMQKLCVWCSLTCLFLFLLPVCSFDVIAEKLLPRPISRSYSLCFILEILQFQVLHFKYLIHFDLIFVLDWDKGSVLFFCKWVSSFPSTMHWTLFTSITTIYIHTIVYFSYCTTVEYWLTVSEMHLFLGSLFHWSICLSKCQCHDVLIILAL